MQAKLSNNSRAGFTLVELLVAAAITVLIVVMLGTMFSSLSSTSLRTNQRIDAFRDARAALQMMERDLSTLLRNQRDPAGNPITRPAAYFVIKDLYDDPATGNQQVYALIAKNSGPGDVCAVGYYCRWDPQLHAYSLYRFFRDSTVTFSRITAAPTYASETDLYTPDPDSTAPASVKDDVLAAYVWNLQIKAFDALGAAITTPLVCDSSATTVVPLPAVIEISFQAISPNAARALVATGAGPDLWMGPATAPAYQRLIAPHAYKFRTRIKL